METYPAHEGMTATDQAELIAKVVAKAMEQHDIDPSTSPARVTHHMVVQVATTVGEKMMQELMNDMPIAEEGQGE